MAVVAEKRTEIDGVAYTTKVFPATQGLDLLQWLIKVFGAPVLELVLRLEDDDLAAMLEALGNGDLGNDVLKAMATVLVDVTKHAEPGEISSLCKATLEHTKFVPAEGQEPASAHLYFDEHFAGRYMHLVEVFIWVVRVSFAKP